MHELLNRALGQAEYNEPVTRAMAFLQAGRVLAVLDRGAAQRVFVEGVAAAENLPLPARQFEAVLHEAVCLGATADPAGAVALFRRLPVSEPRPQRLSAGTTLVQALAQSGEMDAALGLLEDLNCEVGGAELVIYLATDPEVQRRALRAARERWRAHCQRAHSLRHPFGQLDFYRLFSLHWRKLDEAEARAWLEEALRAVEADPDLGTNSRFGERVEFHSMRDVNLFQLLNVLRALRAADEVEAILRVHPEVDAAAKVYPLGLESLMGARPAMRQPRKGAGGGFGYAGSGSAADRRLAEEVWAARQGDPAAIPRLISEARQLYAQDANPHNPNLAPRAFWPSCHAYKTAMYWAGKTMGKDAEPLLAEIPDPDIALLASIEMAAGMLGLPQHAGVRMEHRPERRRKHE